MHIFLRKVKLYVTSAFFLSVNVISVVIKDITAFIWELRTTRSQMEGSGLMAAQ